MCNSTDCKCLETPSPWVEKLIWSVCLNYASEQISIGKACELLECSYEDFKKIFETFPYGTTKDNCHWLDG